MYPSKYAGKPKKENEIKGAREWIQGTMFLIVRFSVFKSLPLIELQEAINAIALIDVLFFMLFLKTLKRSYKRVSLFSKYYSNFEWLIVVPPLMPDFGQKKQNMSHLAVA